MKRLLKHKISIALLGLFLLTGAYNGPQISKILNAAGTIINPATEEKQDDTIAALAANKLYDTGNSTATPLGISGNFKGDWVDTTGYVQAIIEVSTDEDAATDGMLFEYSSTGVADEVDHWHSFTPLDNAATGGHHYPTTLDTQYFRINYTNGATGQTAFTLNTTLFKNASEEGHVHPIEYVIDSDHPASITRAVIVGKTPAGAYVNGGFTTNGIPKSALDEYDDSFLTNPLPVQLLSATGGVPAAPIPFKQAVAQGLVSGYMSVNKFGEAPSGVQTSVTDIWDRADAAPTQQIWVAPTVARTHTIASTDANDTSGGTGARTVRVWGLTSWGTAESSEDLTMNTASPPVTASSYVIIHRIRVLTWGATSQNIGTITATASVDATVTAAIRPGEGTTHMDIYGVPSTQSLSINSWYGSINKSSGTAGTINFKLVSNQGPDVELTNFAVRQERGVQSTGTSDITWTIDPPLIIAGPAIIKIQGVASGADIDGSAGFDGMVIDN